MKKEGRAMVPTPLGRILSAFLQTHLSEYVDVGFTSKVEEKLDEVSGRKRGGGGGRGKYG